MDAHSFGALVLGVGALGVVVWVLAKVGHALAKVAEAMVAAAAVFMALWLVVKTVVWAFGQAVTHWRTTVAVLGVAAWWHWLGWVSLVCLVGAVASALALWRAVDLVSFDRWAGRRLRDVPAGEPTTARLIVTSVRGLVVAANDFNRNYWKPALMAASVPYGRYENGMHDLRHFFASMLLDQGESIKAVAEWLGHADASFTLKTYTHLMPSSDERTKNAVANLYGRKDGPSTAQSDETAE